jgi:hypothetical protein
MTEFVNHPRAAIKRDLTAAFYGATAKPDFACLSYPVGSYFSVNLDWLAAATIVVHYCQIAPAVL